MKPDLNAPVLPEDLRSWLHEALEPDPPRPDDDARLKRRVLRSIARDSTPAHLTVPASPADWHDFGPGLRRKVLHEAGGIMSYLLRLAPGASLPAHRHPVDEECVVLEGEVQIGTLRVAAGGFHLGRRDVLHDRLRSDGGALIFLRGATPTLEHCV